MKVSRLKYKDSGIRCPDCGGKDLILLGKSSNGKQRYRCKNTECSRNSFTLTDEIIERLKKIKEHTCRLCGNTKDESQFFKISLNNGTDICKDCISDIYNTTLAEKGKHTAVLICCHYMDAPFYEGLAEVLKPEQKIGDYFKMLNQHQYHGKMFKDSLLENKNVYSTENYINFSNLAREQIKEIRKCLSRIEEEL